LCILQNPIHSNVKTKPYKDPLPTIYAMNSSDYTSKFKTLIARERNAEMDFHTNEIKSSSAFSREKKGRCVTQMKKQPQKGESDSISIFIYNNNQTY